MLALLWIICRIAFSGRAAVRPDGCSLAVLSLFLTANLCNPSLTAAADDRYNRALVSDRQRGDGDRRTVAKKGAEHLREGTKIPPTVGQVVMLGRRWAFVPSKGGLQQREKDFVLSPPATVPARTAGHDTRPRPKRLGTKSGMPAMRPASAPLATRVAIDPRPEASEEPHILLTENLMLQRIVEAIRADASDDRWMVSGEITEFFRENRLTIRTAQRANSN